MYGALCFDLSVFCVIERIITSLYSGRGPPSLWSWTNVLPTGCWDTSYSRCTTTQWQTQRSWTTMSPSHLRCTERPLSTWCLRSSTRWKWWKMTPLLTLAVVSQLLFWDVQVSERTDPTQLLRNTMTAIQSQCHWVEKQGKKYTL